MLGAKVLIPIVAGAVGLLAFAGKASAKAPSSGTAPEPARGSTPPRAGAKPTKLTTEQVVQRMTAAIQSADPATINTLADLLEKQGFKDQAKDLRGVANALLTVGAQAAGANTPKIVPKPATPIASLPQASPLDPAVVLTKPASGPKAPEIELPNTTIFGSPPSPPSTGGAAANKLAASVALDQQTKPKWKDNRDLVSTFQNQESALGHYVNITTGAPGKVDGLYGPGTALAIAKFYGIVPPSPKYWPTNAQPSLSKYRSELAKLAAADPARADEWNQAAQKAKVT